MAQFHAPDWYLQPLSALQRLLSRFGDRGVIMGGVAASLLGKPRLTYDLDAMFLCTIEQLPLLIDQAALEEILPRIADCEAFARQSRVLLMRHLPSQVNIDISLGILPFEEEVVEHSVLHTIGALSVRLPTTEDLIILKAVAHRPKDMLDIEGLVESSPCLDKARVEYWLRQFSEALETPAIWTDVEELIFRATQE